MTTQSKEERRATFKKAGGASLLGSAVFGFVVSLIIGGAGLLSAALVFSFAPQSTVHIGTVGCAIGAITAFLGGFFAGRKQKHTGTLAGLFFGLLYLVLLLFIGRFYGGNATLPKRLVGYFIFLLLSVLGGGLGTLRVTKKRRPRGRR